MKKRLIAVVLSSLAVLAVTVAMPRGQAAALGTDNVITASGAGVFPAGANVNGIQLAGGTFGVGAQSTSTGSASGDLEVQYNGTSLIGLSQWVTVTGWITSATVNPDGTVTFNGSATLDMGDGTAPTGGLTLVATLGPAGLAVSVGNLTFPTLPKSDGWSSVE
jgi:hypothetical protein